MSSLPADEPFLREGGRMGALLRAFDWSRTPLGAPAGWPQSLKTAVSLMLRARQPVFVGWGPEFISLYNDGYIPICGDKHPHALGRPMSEVWSEIWDQLGPMNEAVLRGDAQFYENHPFELAARDQAGTSYFSFSYTPLLDDEGRIGGLFCSAIETTSTVRLAQEALLVQAAERSVREKDELLRLATDAAEVGLWDLDMVAGRLFWSPRVRAMFGMLQDRPVTLEQDFWGAMHPEDRELTAAAIAAACDPGRRALYDVHFRTVGIDDGLLRWVACKGRVVFDDHGRPLRMIGTAIDITARRAAEQAMEVALAASRTGTFHWDIQDNRLSWDSALDRLFGLRPGEVVRSLDQFVALVHPDDRAGVIERCARCRDFADDFEMEFRVVWPDGSEHWLYDRGRTFVDATGRAKTMTGACVDITERKAAETALRASEQDLRTLADALQRADQQKDEFLATLAHELRNPLAPLRTGLHVLKRSRGADDVDKVRAIMERQLDHMVRLVDELLDVARISQGKITLRQEEVPLRTVLEQAVDASRPLVDAQGHALLVQDVDAQWRVHGDPTRLVQVVGNLLNNAAKYTPRGGRITLRACEDGDALCIAVEDTGVGIPREHVSRVFERFVQIDQHLDRAQGGLGIGLSLVKSLVEMHGGRVAADSEGPGHGSVFRVWLPRAQPQRQPAGDAARVGSIAVAPRKVLIVDDNRDAAETLAMAVQMGGHEVRLAHDGLQALDVARQYDPSVVFLDIGMPGMNGYETAGRLRALPGWGERKLVALTGWGTQEDRHKSLRAGFDLHLTKPVDLALLEEVLAQPPAPGGA